MLFCVVLFFIDNEAANTCNGLNGYESLRSGVMGQEAARVSDYETPEEIYFTFGPSTLQNMQNLLEELSAGQKYQNLEIPMPVYDEVYAHRRGSSIKLAEAPTYINQMRRAIHQYENDFQVKRFIFSLSVSFLSE